MEIQIKIYQAGCGDAIWLTYTNQKGKVFNVLIDGGYKNTYYNIIKPELEELPDDQSIDLWILTHLDNDHINGALAFFEDGGIRGKDNLLKRVWFNWFDNFSLQDTGENIGFGNAIKLRDKFSELGILGERIVASNLPVHEIGDARFTILSPDQKTLDQLLNKWEIYEKEYKKPAPPETVAQEVYPDDLELITQLAARKDRKEDHKDIVNKSSIAFLFEHYNTSILFLGDAHPSVVVDSIKDLLKIRGIDKITVDYLKLAHHGSIMNFSKELLDLIDCQKFIISSDGYNTHKLPNKETLAKILDREDKSEIIEFYFNYDVKRFHDLFKINQDSEVEYNFKKNFPESYQPFINITVNEQLEH